MPRPVHVAYMVWPGKAKEAGDFARLSSFFESVPRLPQHDGPQVEAVQGEVGATRALRLAGDFDEGRAEVEPVVGLVAAADQDAAVPQAQLDAHRGLEHRD